MSKRPPKEKQPGEKPASRIAIGESRSPKKKQADIFARLVLPPHPFEDLPAREEMPNVVPFGYPKEGDSDIQNSENAQNLDIQNLNSTEDLDIQESVQAVSHKAENYTDVASRTLIFEKDVASRIKSSVAIQKHENLENAAIQNLDNAASNIATSAEWLATEVDAVASKIATDKNAASHKSQKSRDWKKVALNRKKASVFVRANEETVNKFKKFCIDQGWDVSYGTELAWNFLMSNAASHTEEDVAIKLAHDDRRLMKMFKTKPSIINHYLRYNEKNKWTTKDDEAAAKFNEVDLRIIELGFIQTQINAGLRKRINSFSYYVNEIETWLAAELSEETLEGILKVHRIRWSQMTGKVISQE